jgi:hypothetical protein
LDLKLIDLLKFWDTHSSPFSSRQPLLSWIENSSSEKASCLISIFDAKSIPGAIVFLIDVLFGSIAVL